MKASEQKQQELNQANYVYGLLMADKLIAEKHIELLLPKIKSQETTILRIKQEQENAQVEESKKEDAKIEEIKEQK